MATSKAEAQEQGKEIALEKQVKNLEAYVRKVVRRLEELIGFDIDGDGKKGGTTRLPVLIALFVAAFGLSTLAAEDEVVRYYAQEGNDAVITLEADEGDDTNDELQLYIDATSNAFHVSIGGTDVMTIDSSGNLNANALLAGTTNYNSYLTLENGEVIDNRPDGTIDLTTDGTDLILGVTGGEGGDASIYLNADESDDSGDTWVIQAEATGNDLSVMSEATEVLNLTTSGDLQIDGDLTISGDGLNSAGDLLITPTGVEVHIDGGLDVGGTTAVGDNNLRVGGTSALIGVATFTAQPVLNAGADINEDIDIDFDAADEEMVVTTSVNPDVAAGAGMVTLYDSEDANSDNSAYLLRLARKNDGGANNEFILCEDNSTGAAGNGDNKFEVNNDGAVIAAGSVTAADFVGNSLDGAGAVDLDIGSADITDITMLTAGGVYIYDAVNNGDPALHLGSAAAEALVITSNLGAGDQLLDGVTIATATSQSSADDGAITLNVDGTDIAVVNDGGVNPAAANTQTLGDAAAEWGDVFLGDGGVINLGSDQDVPITHVADAGILMQLDDYISFGDNAVYIESDDDGYLDLDADTGIRANSALIVSSTAAAPVFKRTVYAAASETNTLTAASGSVITADTTAGAVALTLPDANDVLGATYTIILVTDGGNDLTIARAGADTFNAAGNTLLTFADAEDAVVITAISANRWLIEENIGSVATTTP